MTEHKSVHSIVDRVLRSIGLLLRACILRLDVCRTAVEGRCAVQISPGGQGFQSDLPNSTWYNNGLTGEDYVGLMSIPEIAFGTVHFCEAPSPAVVLPELRCQASACMATTPPGGCRPPAGWAATCACNASLVGRRLRGCNL